MKITKIEAKNYRLLEDFSIDIEEELSLVIGKNNCGKTSLLSILDKFLNSTGITFNDFNLDFIENLKRIIKAEEETINDPMGISLAIFIKYDEEDDLSNVSELLMDLDPTKNIIKLLFEYNISPNQIMKLKSDYNDFEISEAGKEAPKNIEYYLKNNYSSYFKQSTKSVDFNDSKIFIDIERSQIALKKVINYKFIKANRDVSNKEPNKTLSSLSAKIYEKMDMDKELESISNEFIDTLSRTDDTLDGVYDSLFKKTLDKVKKFGGIKPNESNIKITSTLQHKELLAGNTTVLYMHGQNELPEHYNGLGYMNLISMILEIEILINEFKRNKSERIADINLLFIEEPEAHTHPQMQYIFINNIKKLLNEGIKKEGEGVKKIQYIISTHSSHIVSESDFDDIKYLKRNENSVVSKNLKDLEKEYDRDGKKQNYEFLKQYLTLHRAELFFVDKAIFIEGDTERILLPAIMKKLDFKITENQLLSQNISIVEVGNYSHIFENFIDFIGVKSLIITDIDSAMNTKKLKELKVVNSKQKQKVRVKDENASITTNASLKYFYSTDSLGFFKSKTINELTLRKKNQKGLVGVEAEKKWEVDPDGNLACVYQLEEKNSGGSSYHASSFEDSFFHLNRDFIINNKKNFVSLKNIKLFEEKDQGKYTIDAYDLADRCVEKKPAFAIEVLLNSNEDFSNWLIPEYIERGLLWLKD